MLLEAIVRSFRSFKWYLGKDAVYNFITSIIEESKCCADIIKNRFIKRLVMTKNRKNIFENSTKLSVCDKVHVDGDVKVRCHCHITREYRGSARSGCNIKLKLNHKTPNAFHYIKICHSYLFMEELGKFDFKVNAYQMD